MNLKSLFLWLGATFCLAGCCTIDRAALPDGGDHVLARNYGWYLFGVLPVACGDASMQEGSKFKLFSDNVTPDHMQRCVVEDAARHGKTVTDLVCDFEDDIWLKIPFIYIDIPLPYIITYHEIQISGVER